MFCTYFHKGPVHSFADAAKSDTAAFGKFFRLLLDAGVNIAPSQFEAGFMSIAHGREDLDRTVEAARKAFRAL
jgi:glutamate-1-semialdehyde 2,1-aminomutase